MKNHIVELFHCLFYIKFMWSWTAVILLLRLEQFGIEDFIFWQKTHLHAYEINCKQMWNSRQLMIKLDNATPTGV